MSTHFCRASIAAILLLGACGRAPAPQAAPEALPARAEAPDFSVYELESPWRDQDGRERTLASLAGRVQVVAMVYTHCTNTCPLIVDDLKRMERALPPADRAQAGFVLVSLDPSRDTPAQLHEWAGHTRLDPARWTLLTGGEDGVRELAALLGIRYRREAGEEFSHSNAYLVLDRRGRIVYRHDGWAGDLDEPLARIHAAAEASPTD
jgi:protein SCO1/2